MKGKTENLKRGEEKEKEGAGICETLKSERNLGSENTTQIRESVELSMRSRF